MTGRSQRAMEAAVAATRQALAALPTGRARVQMIASIRVDAWGSMQVLEHVALIGIDPPRTLVVTPHDPTLINPITKALTEANLGAMPGNDGVRIRVQLPDPSQERREQIARQARDRAEQGRVAVRMARRDGVNLLKRRRAADEIAEAQLRGRTKSLQAATDEAITRVDQALAEFLADLGA